MPHMKKPADNIPTLLELVGVPEDLNAKTIAEDFLGLSRKAAQRMFEEWGSDFMLRYGEDLMFMAEKGLTLPSMSIRDIGGEKISAYPADITTRRKKSSSGTVSGEGQVRRSGTSSMLSSE